MREYPILFNGKMVRAILAGRKTQTRRLAKQCATPRYAVGDRLWVREAFRLYDATVECACYDQCQCAQHHNKPIYRADCDATCCDEDRWTPSIHMPRAYSRITLEITAARVELLQDIGFDDALAEGIEVDTTDQYWREEAIYTFVDLWDSIYGEARWESNPWVEVYTFRRVS